MPEEGQRSSDMLKSKAIVGKAVTIRQWDQALKRLPWRFPCFKLPVEFAEPVPL